MMDCVIVQLFNIFLRPFDQGLVVVSALSEIKCMLIITMPTPGALNTIRHFIQCLMLITT